MGRSEGVAVSSRSGLELDTVQLSYHWSNRVLAHDIATPPFGHFGESAIQECFRARGRLAAQPAKDKKLSNWYRTSCSFDGNPQGTRILTRLQGGLRTRKIVRDDLTYSQVLTALKYHAGR